MLSAQKYNKSVLPLPLQVFLYEGSTINRSKQLTHGTMLFMGAIVLAILFQAVDVIHSLSKKIEEMVEQETLVPSPPPEKKKFEIIFAKNSPFTYEKKIIKPIMRIREEPKPYIEPVVEIPEIVPPPKPKVVPKKVNKPKVLPKKQEEAKDVSANAEMNAAAVDAQSSNSEYATTQSSGASGDQVVAELLNAVNRYKQYPRMAKRANIEGVNFLAVTIKADGSVSSARLSKGSGNKLLDKASQNLINKLLGIKLSAPNKTVNVNIPIQYNLN